MRFLGFSTSRAGIYALNVLQCLARQLSMPPFHMGGLLLRYRLKHTFPYIREEAR